MPFVEAVSPTEIPLAIVKAGAIHIGVATLKIGMLTQVNVHGIGNELRGVVSRMQREHILISDLKVQEGPVSHLAGYGKYAVVALPEVAVELGIVEIGANSAVSDFAPGGSVHLVQGSMGVSGLLAGTERGVKGYVASWPQMNPRADSLEKQFIDEARADN